MSTAGMISERIAVLLAQDGFKQPTRGIFVRPWDECWRGWLTVDRGSHMLLPKVGVFSEELLDVRACALGRIGEVWKKRKDGPPLIMMNLQQLAEGDPDCSQRMTWRYTGEELKPSVSDDVVYCFRKVAYPCIEGHLSYEAVLGAVMKGRASPALQHFLPIILIKLGRFDDLSTYLEGWTAKHRDRGTMASDYERYVNALLEMDREKRGFSLLKDEQG
jgi:hypothetical protein